MSNNRYAELDKLIKEYEEDSITVRSERLVMKNYPKVLTMSAASSFEHNIKNACQDFLDNPKLPIVPNYPKINSIRQSPLVDKIYGKLEAYNDNGIQHLAADKFYELFGASFKADVQTIFAIKLQEKKAAVTAKVNALLPLCGTDDKYDLDYAKQCDLKIELDRCNFDDAESAFLNLKLRRNRVAHDYIHGLSDTFEDILKFYNLAVIYAISIEEAIKNLTAT